MSKNSAATAKLMAERYGQKNSKSQKQRIFFVALAAILVIGFLYFAAMVAIRGANEVKTQDLGYEIVSSEQAQVSFSVTSPIDGRVRCAIQVLNQSFAVVGYKETSLAVRANTAENRQISVNTIELGVSGLVDKCWFE